MGKRKVDIFTVVESINNWFEANNHDLTIPEGSAELGNQSGPNEDAVQAKGIEADESGPRLIGFTVDVGSGTSAAEVAPPGGLELEGGTTDPFGLRWTIPLSLLKRYSGDCYRPWGMSAGRPSWPKGVDTLTS